MKRMWKFAAIFAAFVILGVTACDDGNDPGSGTKTDAARPSITAQPAGGAYLPGATVKPLSVTASVSDGGTLSYQWYSDTAIYSSNATKIEGATSAAFTPPAVTAGTLYYYAEVTNTNNSVDGTKTAVMDSNRAKLVIGWESVGYGDIDYGTSSLFSPRSIIFANNLFVAVGGSIAVGGGQIGWSDDGVKWKLVETTIFGDSVLNGIAYGSNRFIAVGDGGKMASSTDGKTWTSVDASSVFGTSDINDIAYGSNQFVAVGGNLSGGSPKSATSTDGTTWAAVTAPTTLFTNTVLRVVSGGGSFRSYLSTSNQCPYLNNTYWQGEPISDWTGTSQGIYDLVYGKDYFVAVGTNGNVFKTSGSSWTSISPSEILGTNLITKAAYGSGKLFVFTSNKGAWSGDDGATWTEVPFVNMSRMAYGAGRFVAVAGGSGISYASYP